MSVVMSEKCRFCGKLKPEGCYCTCEAGQKSKKDTEEFLKGIADRRKEWENETTKPSRILTVCSYCFKRLKEGDPCDCKHAAERKNKMKRAYICHPYAGDIEGNVNKVRAICKDMCKYVIPIAPHLFLSQYLNETIDRDLILEHCKGLIEGCDEFWICGSKMSAGMVAEFEHVLKINDDRLLSR